MSRDPERTETELLTDLIDAVWTLRESVEDFRRDVAMQASSTILCEIRNLLSSLISAVRELRR